MSDIAVPRPKIRSYRWGKFQGWAMISIGLVQLVVTMLLFYRPDYWPQNDFAVGYFKSFVRHHAGQNEILLAAY